MRTFRSQWVAVAVWCALFGADAARGDVAANRSFDTTNASLAQALKSYALTFDQTIIFTENLVVGMKANGLRGEYSAGAALEELLKGTGLVAERNSVGAVVIRRREDVKPTATDPDPTSSRESQVEEIVVTATKRSTGLQETPMSVSVLTSDAIQRRGLSGMADYLSSVPSVNVLDQGAGRTVVIMRGLAANAQTDALRGPLVGVYFGETPISGLGTQGGTADIKMIDLERVEVLRGPQGTLFGSSSLGGTVRNLPAQPNLDVFTGSAQLGGSNTAGFGGGNSEARAVLNVPLIGGALAMRVVGYRFDESGYYKNIAASDPGTASAVGAFGASAANRNDIGSAEHTGGRVSLLWKATDHLTMKLNYLDQKIDQNGWPQADLELGQQAFLQRRLQLRHSDGAPTFGLPQFDEKFADRIQIPNVVLEYDLGWGSLLSSSSWIEEKSDFFRDLSSFFGFVPWSQPIFYSSDAFVQEVRFVSQWSSPFQLVAGAYYEHIDQREENWGLWGGDAALNAFAAPDQLKFLHNTTDVGKEQKALFGDLSFSVTEKVRLTVGARAFSFSRHDEIVNDAAVFSPASLALSDSKESDVNYKAGVDFTPVPGTLVYASWSQGFRLGGPVAAENNPACDRDGDGLYDGSGGVSTAGRQIDSDFVDSFEVGAKRSFLNNRLRLGGALYQLNWEGIPITVVFDFCNGTLNAGKARSRGIEFESSYSLSNKLSVDFSAAYVNAELTQDATFLGSAGDRLPGSPKSTAHLGMQYGFNVGPREAFVRGDYSYVGGFYNNLQQTGPQIGNFGMLNLRAGTTFGRLDIAVFANNVTNNDSLTWVDSSGFINQRGNLLRPRTLGVNAGYRF